MSKTKIIVGVLLLVTAVFIAAYLANILFDLQDRSAVGAFLTIPTREVSMTPPPGWSKYQGEGFEIWLPQNWEGGDLSKNIDATVERISQRESRLSGIKTLLQQGQSQFGYSFIAFDLNSFSKGFADNVTVTKQQTDRVMTPYEYVRKQTDLISNNSNFKIIKGGFGREKEILDRYDAAKFIVQISNPSGTQMSYAIQVRNAIWVVGFSSSNREFENQQPTFEQIIRTFYVYP